MKIYMLRHGLTSGNLEKRYIGRTDEPLCEEGKKQLKELCIPVCEVLICSPMLRCIQTAKLLFGEQQLQVVKDLRECDFGDFEGRNYSELNGDPDYQRWIDSGGKMRFPNGEEPERFKERCCKAFADLIKAEGHRRSAAMVVHGGTIMSVLEKYALPHRDYYDWSVPNGHGYLCEADGEKITILEKI